MYQNLELHLRVICCLCGKKESFWSRVEVEHERPSWDDGEQTFSTTGHTLRVVDPPGDWVYKSMGWGTGRDWKCSESCYGSGPKSEPLQSSVPPPPPLPSSSPWPRKQKALEPKVKKSKSKKRK